ncbi:MAG: iron ABC transporter permease [Archaeoglobaceae archaeon]
MKVLLLILLCIISMFLGVFLGPAGIIDFEDPVMRSLALDYRLPRTILAMLVGAALASSGCAMQAFFRNPLADPYILGVSSAASAGAAIAISIGFAATSNIILAAFVSSLLTSFAVYRLGKRGESYAILLAGIAVASFLSGLTAIVIYFSQESVHEILFWTMGSFSKASWQKVTIILFPFILGTFYLIINTWNLNAVLLGDEHAKSLGLNIEKFRRELIAVVSLLTSASVAVCGVIGFVGIIVPHTMRLIFGESHQKLLPAAIIFGMTIMPFVDLLSRISTSGEIPVGAMTAMIGAPFFIYVLRRGL